MGFQLYKPKSCKLFFFRKAIVGMFNLKYITVGLHKLVHHKSALLQTEQSTCTGRRLVWDSLSVADLYTNVQTEYPSVLGAV